MEFFASFTAQDWLTFVMASLAVLVAGAELIQNHFFRQRPHFEFEWADEIFEGPDGMLIGVCRFWNDGDATARNLRLNIEAEGMVCNLKHWDHWDEFRPGERHGFEVPFEPAIRGWGPPGPDLQSTKVINAVDPKPRTPPGQLPSRRRPLVRPVVSLQYRGKRRPVTTKAPSPESLSLMGGGGC
ncbi:hypothetical protein [Microbacterium sp. MTN4-26]|uniref:hypothetical protein n=1 Tax=unclassified Microbacterium TaxID=2609290 RepID=UPI0036F248DC